MNTITRTITVSDQHIKDARKVIMFRDEENCHCPISLSLFEAILGSYRVVKDQHWKRHRIKFSTQINPFDVATDIRVTCPSYLSKFLSIEHLGNHPPINISLNSTVKQFIIDFDKYINVTPFKFKIAFIINHGHVKARISN
jgi:hypothetical protein